MGPNIPLASETLAPQLENVKVPSEDHILVYHFPLFLTVVRRPMAFSRVRVSRLLGLPSS